MLICAYQTLKECAGPPSVASRPRFFVCQTAPNNSRDRYVRQGSRVVCCGPLIRLRCSDCPVKGRTKKNIFWGNALASWQARDALRLPPTTKPKRKTFFFWRRVWHKKGSASHIHILYPLLHCTAEPTNPPSTSPFGQARFFPIPYVTGPCPVPQKFFSSRLPSRKTCTWPFAAAFFFLPSPTLHLQSPHPAFFLRSCKISSSAILL